MYYGIEENVVGCDGGTVGDGDSDVAMMAMDGLSL